MSNDLAFVGVANADGFDFRHAIVPVAMSAPAEAATSSTVPDHVRRVASEDIRKFLFENLILESMTLRQVAGLVHQVTRDPAPIAQRMKSLVKFVKGVASGNELLSDDGKSIATLHVARLLNLITRIGITDAELHSIYYDLPHVIDHERQLAESRAHLDHVLVALENNPTAIVEFLSPREKYYALSHEVDRDAC